MISKFCKKKIIFFSFRISEMFGSLVYSTEKHLVDVTFFRLEIAGLNFAISDSPMLSSGSACRYGGRHFVIFRIF